MRGLRVAFRKCFANAHKKGGIWRINGRRREGRLTKDEGKNAREKEEKKGGDGSERMERERKYKFMLFYLLRNFVINKKFLMCCARFANSCEYDYESPFAINPLNPELNPICYLLALLGAHHFLHVSRIRVKLLTFRLLMSYICGAPILDVSRSHTTTQHSR